MTQRLFFCDVCERGYAGGVYFRCPHCGYDKEEDGYRFVAYKAAYEKAKKARKLRESVVGWIIAIVFWIVLITLFTRYANKASGQPGGDDLICDLSGGGL